ncbi:HAD family hydrolase [Terrisporobacter sp.]|uniref:HAD family hydrolase n=1 Tax=Terrisporobacter sp. TaxID=1965305 RepID=UPI002622D568|nr:HAD family phosphatase [Terrisporobacter sp.]
MLDFKGAIFDLDGTLIDSMKIWEKIDMDFLNKRNIKMPADYIEMINSMSFDKVAKYTIDRFGLNEKEEDIIKEWHEMAVYEYTNNIKLKPYVKEYLHKLKHNNIKIGLATTSPKYLYEPVLKNNNIYELFDELVSLEDVTRDKNYPDIYLLTSEKLGVNPNDCVGFEDILIGINTMKKINIKCIGVYDESSLYEIDKIKDSCDIFIHSFKELL